MGWVGVALQVVGAASSIYGGMQGKKEAEYNAELYEKKAEQVDVQARIEAGQYDRAKRQLKGTSIANTAKAGLAMGGSPLAVMIDSLAQLEMDKQIGQYNLQMEKTFTQSQAQAYKLQGKRAMTSGLVSGFSQLMMTGAMLKTPTTGGLKGVRSDVGKINTSIYGRY